MAVHDNKTPVTGSVTTKGDVILDEVRKLSSKYDQLYGNTLTLGSRVEALITKLIKVEQKTDKVDRTAELSARQSDEIYSSLIREYTALKKEIREELGYISAQNASIHDSLTEKITGRSVIAAEGEESSELVTEQYLELDYELLAKMIAEQISGKEPKAEETIEEPAPVTPEEYPYPIARSTDDGYAAIADSIARLSEQIEELKATVASMGGSRETPAAEALSDTHAAAEIDYDLLAGKIAGLIVVPAAGSEELNDEIKYLASQNENIYTEISKNIEDLSAQIAEIKSLPVAETEEEAASETPVEEAVVDETAVVEEVAAEEESEKLVIDYDKLAIDYDKLAVKIAELIPAQEVISPDYIASKVAEMIVIPEPAPAVNTDDEEFIDKIAVKVGALKADEFDIVVDEEGCASISKEIAERLDYETIADIVAEKLRPAMDAMDTAEEPDYDAVAASLSEKIGSPAINEEAIAEKAAAALSNYLPEIDVDEIADRVATQVLSAMPAVDNEAVAAVIAEKLAKPADNEVDILADEAGVANVAQIIADRLEESELSERVAERVIQSINNQTSDDTECETLSEEHTEDTYNETDRADAIAQQIIDRIISDEVGDKLAARVVEAIPAAPNSDEIVERVVAGVTEAIPAAPNSDEIVERVVAGVTEVIPAAPNSDEIAEKVVAGVTEVIPAALNADEIVEKVVAGLDEAFPVEEDYEEPEETEEEYDISIDEQGIDEMARQIAERLLASDITVKVAEQVAEAVPSVDDQAIADAVSEKLAANDDGQYDAEELAKLVADIVTAENEARFDGVDGGIRDIKAMLAGGAVVRAADELVFDDYGSDLEEVEEIFPEEETVEPAEETATDEGESDAADNTEEAVEDNSFAEEAEEPAETEEEELVTVSDLVDGDEENALSEEAEEPAEAEEEELVTVSDLVDDNSEEARDELAAEAAYEAEPIEETEYVQPVVDVEVKGEKAQGEVDFINMMKYNRSFIARIIQSTDDQKNYYGAIKNALLSYKKVNSNIAWGAERFHKGRETIARFKIRGKTLVLYLALDPSEYKQSVYHHSDVSNNKSLHGTPMMVKIKSPRGVKKAIRLIDEMLAKRDGIKRSVPERDYAAMYPYETIEELIEDGLVKDVSKNI